MLYPSYVRSPDMDPNIWLCKIWPLSTLDRNLDPENLAYTALWLARLRAEHEVRDVSSRGLSFLWVRPPRMPLFGAGQETGDRIFRPQSRSNSVLRSATSVSRSGPVRAEKYRTPYCNWF
jgi:hypothetical protein